MEKVKAVVTLLVGMIVLLSQLAMLPAHTEGTKDISVVYLFDESEILEWLDAGRYMRNNRIQAIAGEPLAPYRTAKILLPPYAEVAGVSVQAEIGGKHVVKDIPWGQPPVITSEEPKTVEKNVAIYGSDELYPEKAHRVGIVSSFRGYNILHVRLYPVQYMPASKVAIYYAKMTVRVRFETEGSMDNFRNLVKDREIAETLVDNPWTLSTYDSIPATIEMTNTTYEYLIVTTVPLLDEFQVLADWKAKFVQGARVETVSANASAQEIKDIINEYYTYYDTSYVLLGGDVEVIPYHTKNVTFKVASDRYTANIAEDFWFANLDGDDNISYYEVYIGRAPVDNDTEAASFAEKVIAHEQKAKPKANLFHQSRLRLGNDPDSRELPWQCMQYIPADYTNHTLFEENGKVDRADWVNFWRNDSIMCEHIGHGSNRSYIINLEVGSIPGPGPVFWRDTNIADLDNTFWPVHTSAACFSGAFEHEDCLAEAYVKDPDNGAIACLMNDKYGFYLGTDATHFSGDFVERQFEALYQRGYENTGAMLAHSKHEFIDEATNESDPYRGIWEWCWREINLIGDPETPLLTKRLSPPSTPLSPSGPTSGYVYITYNYSTSTTDPEGDDVRYEFSWGDDTSTITDWYASGADASASHYWDQPATYDVKVRAQDVYEAWSGWSSAIQVTLSQNPPPGCPYVSTWDGDRYVLDNNLLTASEVSNGTDVEDYYKLEQALVFDNGKYKLLISEFEHEHDFFDRVQLLAVDHDKDVNVDASPYGEILTYTSPCEPESAIDGNGENVKHLIETIDENYYQGYNGSCITLDFGDLDISNGAKLVMRADPPPMEKWSIHIQVLNEGGSWETVATVIPRVYWATEIINLFSYLPDANEDLKVKLYFTGNHKLDYIGLDTSCQADYELHYANLVSAVHSTQGDVKSELLESDCVYAEQLPGEQIVLAFTLPRSPTDTRTFIFYLKGHYHTMS